MVSIMKDRPSIDVTLTRLISFIERKRTPLFLWDSHFMQPDIELSALILWFTKNAYKHYRQEHKYARSCDALIRILELHLRELNKKIYNIKERDVLTYLHAIATITKHYQSEEKNVGSIIGGLIKYIIPIIERSKNYEFKMMAISLLVIIVLSIGNMKDYPTIIDMYIHNIHKFWYNVNRWDSASIITCLYWITESLKLLLEKHPDFRRDPQGKILSFAKGTEQFIIEKPLESIRNFALDIKLWVFFVINNLTSVYDFLGETISSRLSNINEQLEKDILYGLPIDIELYVTKKKRRRLDLITVSLAIGALYLASKDIITYVTRWDIQNIDRTRKFIFFMGLLAVLGTTIIIPRTITSLTIVLSLPITIIAEIIIAEILIFLVLLTGASILYNLAKGTIRSVRDLKNLKSLRLLPYISILYLIIRAIITFLLLFY